MSLNPLKKSSVSKCKACPMLGMDHVPSSGNADADVMIIGQSPGANEVEQGLPFVGPSGELLEMMLEQAELDRGQVYIANALKCHPPANRKGTEQELRVCYNIWLKREIKIVDPEIIILTGKDAFMSVTPESQHDRWGHLNIIKSKLRRYLVTYHPSYFLRRGKINDFIEVGDKLKEMIEDV